MKSNLRISELLGWSQGSTTIWSIRKR